MQWKEPEKGKRRKEEASQPAKLKKKREQGRSKRRRVRDEAGWYGPHNPQDEGSPSRAEQAS